MRHPSSPLATADSAHPNEEEAAAAVAEAAGSVVRRHGDTEPDDRQVATSSGHNNVVLSEFAGSAENGNPDSETEL